MPKSAEQMTVAKENVCRNRALIDGWGQNVECICRTLVKSQGAVDSLLYSSLPLHTVEIQAAVLEVLINLCFADDSF